MLFTKIAFTTSFCVLNAAPVYRKNQNKNENKKLCMDYCNNGSSKPDWTVTIRLTFHPPLISIHAFFPRSFTTDHLTVGCNTAWQSLRSEQIVTIHPHTVLAPPPLRKYPGDDCFQVTTWPPENAHGSSPCIYPYVKWVKGASLKHMI